MSGSRKSEVHHLFGPIPENGRAKSTLVHVRAKVIPPPWSEVIELVVCRRRIAIGVAPKIGQADMSNDVNSFKRGQTFKQVKREGSKIVRVEKSEVQSIPIQGLYDFGHRRTSWSRKGPNRRTDGRQTLFCRC